MRRRRITTVDDSAEFLQMMNDLLGEDGYEVVTLVASHTSMDGLAATTPDLLIVDVLPSPAEQSAWQLVTRSRADHRLASVPVIITTTHPKETERRAKDLIRMGKVRVLPKPFDIARLEALIERLTGVQTPDLDGDGAASRAGSARPASSPGPMDEADAERLPAG